MSESQQEEFVFVIEQPHHRKRADKVLTELLEGHSRTQVQRLFDRGFVWRDEASLAKSDSVRAGDVLHVTVPPLQPLVLRPVAISLDVLFEDEDMIAVNKAPGMVTHPGVGTGEDTLVHALLHHCSGQLSGIGGIERPGIVHRLDKETSGVMVAAKSNRAFQALADMFADRTLEKKYWAIVKGLPQKSIGTVNAPIGRHPVHRHRMAVRTEGREAISNYNVVERFQSGFALVEVHILTGRTHQIRVHMSHVGFPIAGDATYGYRASKENAPEFPRVMLHARTLRLNHPVTGEAMCLEAPVPDDFTTALGGLRGESGLG